MKIWEHVLSDIRFAVRLCWRAPRESLLIILCVAVGVGITAAMFTVVDGILVHPRSFIRAPARVLHLDVKRQAKAGVALTALSYQDYLALARAPRAFDVVAAEASATLVAVRGDVVAPVQVTFATGSVFRLAAGPPKLGRYPISDADWTAGDLTAVVSEDFATHLQADPAHLIGSSLSIAGVAYTVTAIAPSGYRGVGRGRTDVWLPLSSAGADIFGPAWQVNPGAAFLDVVGRVSRRTAVPQARSEVVSVLANASEAGPFASRIESVNLIPIGRADYAFGPRAVVMPLVLACLGAAVFLIAVANVCLLYWLGLTARVDEFTIRRALGGGRSDIARLCVTRLWALVIVGGVTGVGVSALVGESLGRLGWTDVGADNRVTATALILTAAMLVLASIPVGVFALHRPLLGSSSRSLGPSRAANRWARGLVVGQIGVTFAFCALALLFAASLRHLLTTSLGFDAMHVIALDVTGASNQGHASELESILEPIRARVDHTPGVVSTALALSHPFGSSIGRMFKVRSADTLSGPDTHAAFNAVEPTFARTMGLRVRSGRDFRLSDGRGDAPVAIVTLAFSAKYFPHRSPLGACVEVTGAREVCTTIVGVVDNFMQHDVQESARPQLLVPLRQFTNQAPVRTLLIRTAGPATDYAAAIRSALGTDAHASGITLTIIDSRVRAQLEPWYHAVALTGCFGLLALSLCLFGIYGATASRVAARLREFGLRLALGAPPRAVRTPIQNEALLLAVGGIVLGVTIVIPLMPVIAPLIVTGSGDVGVAFGIAALTMIAGTLITIARLVRIAGTLDPADLLRQSG